MKIYILSILALAMLMSPGSAQAGKIVIEYNELISIISGYHGLPEADYWAKLDPDSARASLMRIANDQKVHPVARTRALYALVYFQNDDTLALMKLKAKSGKVPYIRSQAYQALAKASGVLALEDIGKGLQDSSVLVRLSASRALQGIGGERAKALLRDSLKTEKNKTVSYILDKSLKNMK